MAKTTKKYDHKKIEKKWQKEWEGKDIYKAKDGKGKKFYALVEFPYPSGDGLHNGHVRGYTAMDIVSRKKRMEGKNVLYPIGWDAFGLPTENFAIKTGIHPIKITKTRADTYRRQMKSMGLSFDWSREINTTDPEYYKWTQWIFLQMFKKGLAYKAKSNINWCLSCKIGLANEEVIDGACERCGGQTEKREKEQWMLAITKYADRLLADLDSIDYLEKVKAQQRNWIGKSEGSLIDFKIKNTDKKITVFTTRADTLFGVTYLVLAPEHKLIDDLRFFTSNQDEVDAYVVQTKSKSDIERQENKEKTGTKLFGVMAINPANGEEIPVYIADYVLANYGTGAVMAVPAHDERDFEFAKKFNLPIRQVILPVFTDFENPPQVGKKNTFRKTILAIVHDPKTNRYLCLKWKKHPWTTFITGGVEEGEDVTTAARREIQEETGYANIRFVRNIGPLAEAHFFAAHKDVNRRIHNQSMLFELVDNVRGSVAPEEEAQYDIEWLTFEELVAAKMRHSEIEMMLHEIKYGNGSSLYTGDGVLVNSRTFDDTDNQEAKKKITEFVGGKVHSTFKLRDWVFSRQRYWGEPIPMIHCETCGWQPVPEKELPVKLPNVKNYKPTDNGESPLSTMTSWVNTKCPKCKGKAKRETDVMPNWAGSSWYFLRYTDPKNKKAFADKKKLKYWTPVDWYNGGMEHTTLHLLYSRFWHKFLYDIKAVPTKEPYKKRTSHGMILAEDGTKMSKSKGNVVNPDSVVDRYGADTLRVYEMFMGPFDQAIAWDEKSIIGSRRFVEKVWNLSQKVAGAKEKVRASPELERIVHQTIKKVGEDIEAMRFNTAISQMMICANEMEKAERIPYALFAAFLVLVAPFAPHITEEIWHNLGNKKTIHREPWPKFNPKKLVSETVTLAVQVNGKMRGTIDVAADASEADATAAAKQVVEKWITGDIKKVIYVPKRMVSIVV